MFILGKLVDGTSITSSPGQLYFQHTLQSMKYHTQAVKLMTETPVTPPLDTTLPAAACLYLLQSECLSLCSISGLHIPIQEAVLPDSREDGWANGWLGLPYSSSVWPWCHQYSLQSQWNCDGGLFLTWVQMLTEYGILHSLVYFNWWLCLSQNLGPFQYAGYKGFLYW